MASLKKVLDKLKADGEVFSYEIELTSEQISKTRSEATIRLEINKFPLIQLHYTYNPETRPAKEVFELLKEDLDTRLVKTGIWALISNQLEKNKAEIGEQAA